MNVNELFERIPLPVKPRLPAFGGATGWLNTEPLTPADLRGKVVLVDFWTYTCINWIRTLPYIRAWAETYGRTAWSWSVCTHPSSASSTTSTAFASAARDMRVEYPIAIDNDYAVWNAFANQYWPALYIADAEGRIRYQHFGEGGYERRSESSGSCSPTPAPRLPEGPALSM